MGIFSLDENPEYIHLECQIEKITDIVFSCIYNDLTDKEKINLIKEILLKQ